MRCLLSWIAACCACWPLLAQAQSATDAQWVWYDEGEPPANAPAGETWFRHEVRATDPSTGEVRVACSDPFTLWINGREIVQGEGGRAYRFNLNGIVDRGPNVVCVQVQHAEGPAGLFIDGEVRSQGGSALPFDSSSAWRATHEQPTDDWLAPRYDATAWLPVRVLGPHAESPWNELSFGENYLDRYQVPDGFRLQRIAEPELSGPLIAITWGLGGRLIGSRERGPIVALSDTSGDGVFDEVVEVSPALTNCQGLLTVGDDLLAVGDGPQGAGMYRLRDTTGDGVADEVLHLTGYKGGMGEHGPHDIVLGPDGWLYHNSGNHAWIQHEPAATSPIVRYYEGDLWQPRMEDPNGHAVGIPAPGGTVWRFTPDGQQWFLHTMGFRNHYDIGFSQSGDLFTFDSDMEWEVGMPFYRPVRVNHCTPGADFGWRSNGGKWAPYFFDSLPAAVDTGRGSPTGVVIYEHVQLPEQYQGALLACDWSMGRILAIHLTPSGASYGGAYTTLLSGNPLNVSDIEVDRDGSVVFATGGRGTEGGVYRLSYGEPTEALRATDLAGALSLPQSQAAWAREDWAAVKAELGDGWEEAIANAARTGTATEKIRALTMLAQLGPYPSAALLVDVTTDDDPHARAFAFWLLGEHGGDQLTGPALAAGLTDPDPVVLRRVCEAYVRSGLPAPVDSLLPLLAHADRWVRYAARGALERIPVEQWQAAVLSASNPRVQIEGLLVLHRLGAVPPNAALRQEADLLAQCKRSVLPAEQLDVLRLISLSLIAGAEGSARMEIGLRLLDQFPRTRGGVQDDPVQVAIDREAARVVAALQTPGAAKRLVQAMEQATEHAQQVHYAMACRYLETGWNFDLKRRMLDWYEQTQTWEGGHSFAKYLENIVLAQLPRLSPDERRQLLLTWTERPFATRLLLTSSTPENVADYEATLASVLAQAEAASGASAGEVITSVIDALGRSGSAESEAALRRLFEQQPDHRDQIVRSLALHPAAENWEVLVQALRFADPTSLQLVVRALREIDRAPEKAEDFRQLILAGLKLGAEGGTNVVALLEKWTGQAPTNASDLAAALAEYQAWFREKYPLESPPELIASTDAGYTLEQLLGFLEQDPVGRSGSPERGRAVFAKANCIKCHRFGQEGQGVGPDLTSVRRRFQRREIIESLLNPSLVVSDQYRSVTIVTKEGLVHTGMPVQQPNAEQVVLVLPDATRLEIARADIDEEHQVTKSVMPENILKPLTLSEIADLFAFLETSRNNPLPVETGGGQ